MRTRVAARLVQRVRARRGQDQDHWVGRLDWWRLRRAGEQGVPEAVDALWAWWLSDPDERAWQVLTHRRHPAATGPERALSLIALGTGTADEVRGALVDAAGRSGHPVAVAARTRLLRLADQSLFDELCAAAVDHPGLAAFCMEHGLAPAEPAAQVMFFLLTGQAEQYRAVDPDGSLLAVGYSAAPIARRQRLRTALAEAGGFDVARLLGQVGRQGLLTRMSRDELDYVAGELAGRGDIAELWGLVLDLSLEDAVSVMPRFPGTWRPAEPDERDLYELLAAADPDVVTAGRRAFSRQTRVTVPGRVWCGALTNDGRRLAVATTDGGTQAVSVFAVPSGTLLDRLSVPDAAETRLAFRGTTLVVAQLHESRRTPLLLRSERGTSQPVTSMREEVRHVATGPARRRPGFVVLGRDNLLVFRRDGGLTRRVSLGGQLGLPNRSSTAYALATAPESGLIAVAEGTHLVVVHARRTDVPLDRAVLPADVSGAAFTGHAGLVTTDARGIRLWSVDEDTLRPAASATTDTFVDQPLPVRGRNEIAVLDVAGNAGRVRYFDAGSLAEVSGTRELTGVDGRVLFGSSNGAHHALGGEGHVHVVSVGRYEPAAALATRPARDLRPAHLALVEAALRNSRLTRPAGTLLRLLKARLSQRFATAIALGLDTGTASLPFAAGDGTDIALAPGEEDGDFLALDEDDGDFLAFGEGEEAPE